MILRVYAMWNRSRMILSILLFLYVVQTIIIVVWDGIYDNPAHILVTIGQVLNLSFCHNSFIDIPATVQMYRIAPRLALAATLVILAISQTLKQSFEMYKVTKQWQPNRYMQKLVGDGILYFIVNVLYHIDYVLASVAAPTNNTRLFLTVFLYILFYTLIPRLIISIRELYDHDIRGRFHIDTGFGVVSQSNAGPDITMSAMVFVNGNQGPEVHGGTSNSSDLEMGSVYGSGLDEDSVVGGRE